MRCGDFAERQRKMAAVGALIARLQAFAQQPAALEATGGRSDDVSGRSGLSVQQMGEASQAVADELMALQAIYGEDCVALLTVQRTRSGGILTNVIDGSAPSPALEDAVLGWHAQQPIRLALTVELDLLSSSSAKEGEESGSGALGMRLSAILPSGYPMASSLPQLQLLSRYIGSHGVDHTLFGEILRIFMQSSKQTTKDHVIFEPGQVALFDGIEKARELVERWFHQREKEASERRKAAESDSHPAESESGRAEEEEVSDKLSGLRIGKPAEARGANTPTVKLITAPAITERKSTFVGHAAAVHDPELVPSILSGLLQDRRVARATHPAIYAWVCRTAGGVVHRDCDDDGETAAGGRLAHLLDLLHLENAIVIVTRWYGGVLLGPDRFKLIGRAARDALELASLVDGPLNPNNSRTFKGRRER